MEVVAATDAQVVSVGELVLAGHKRDTPVSPRYDVVYLLDGRGWYYRYSHLKEIDKNIVPGRIISQGDRIGLLGKEGGSGGWSHLHFEIKSRQPSGNWGTQEGYAFLWETYLEQHKPSVIAVARPHHTIFSGETAHLDGSRSLIANIPNDSSRRFIRIFIRRAISIREIPSRSRSAHSTRLPERSHGTSVTAVRRSRFSRTATQSSWQPMVMPRRRTFIRNQAITLSA